MPQRKPYSPNTQYGRRKLNEQHEKWKQSLPKQERKKLESNALLFSIGVFVAICLLILAIAGPDTLMRWLSGKRI